MRSFFRGVTCQEVFDTVVGVAVLGGVAAVVSGFFVFVVIYDTAVDIDARFRPRS